MPRTLDKEVVIVPPLKVAFDGHAGVSFPLSFNMCSDNVFNVSTVFGCSLWSLVNVYTFRLRKAY